MRSFGLFALAGGLIGSALARPLMVHPGDKSSLIITADSTVNGTHVSADRIPAQPHIAATEQLALSVVNNFDGDKVNCYVTGADPATGQVVMLKPGGGWLYPSAGGSATPVSIDDDVAIPLDAKGSTTELTFPGYIESGRIWFAEGELQFFVVAGDGGESLVTPSAVNLEDPSADVNWGFVELTNTEEAGIYANISYVDFVGMILSMALQTGSNGTQITKGLEADAVGKICNDLKLQTAKDGQPWEEMCLLGSDGEPLRVLSPTDFGAGGNGTAFADYWTDYVDQVWDKYSSSPLTINTQADAGEVSCQVSGDELTCDGDNRGYAKPVPADIWGCNSGPFGIEEGDTDLHKAIVPRLCAAFVRSTLLLDGGDSQPGVPATDYYTTSPTNHYSRIIHKYETDGKGYAFAYDDVNPDGNENASGVVSDANPQKLTVYVGGYNA
jgi:hypothetical protein